MLLIPNPTQDFGCIRKIFLQTRFILPIRGLSGWTKVVTVRKATVADVAAITEIYNEAILNTTATFDTQRKNLS
jgi:hypothetical protein